jgi:hypothetical protein
MPLRFLQYEDQTLPNRNEATNSDFQRTEPEEAPVMMTTFPANDAFIVFAK